MERKISFYEGGYEYALLSNTNSSNFKYLIGNRGSIDFTPNEKKIKGIISYICEGNVIPPILVNKTTGTVMEGNHRLYAFRKMWNEMGLTPSLPCVFCELATTEEELCESREINNKQDRWQSWQFVLSDAIGGNIGAQKYANFAKTHDICKSKNDKISTRITSALLSGNDASHKVNSGIYNFSDRDYVNAESTIKEIEQIINAYNEHREPGIKEIKKCTEKFIIAWCYVKKQKIFDEIPVYDIITKNWDYFLNNFYKSYNYVHNDGKEEFVNKFKNMALMMSFKCK